MVPSGYRRPTDLGFQIPGCLLDGFLTPLESVVFMCVELTVVRQALIQRRVQGPKTEEPVRRRFWQRGI